MKLSVLYAVILVLVFTVNPAMAMGDKYSGYGKANEKDSMTPLDKKEGKGSSNRLAAQGTMRYDKNTGMMNVVPSDSTGNIQD